ncbi:zinc-ribbon domain-containing protein [Halobacillus alkaliphilus]|uniref:zinc-ribbon domain-containing protein n=1 Tax=Halobacillus alkaliphilus TaxID=396056 RepID=UPI003CCBE3F4
MILEGEGNIIYCSACGAKNNQEANFCVSCGKSLNQATEVEKDNKPTSSANDISSNNVSKESSNLYLILGWVFSVISLLFIPILFAAGGVIFGYLHRKNDQTHGTIIMIAAVACGIFGTIFGMATVGY